MAIMTHKPSRPPRTLHQPALPFAFLMGCWVWFTANAACAQEPNGLAAAAAIQDAFVKVIESSEKSVVSIARDKRSALAHPDLRRQFPGARMNRELSPGDADWIPNEFGAGIVIDRNGLILTNYHLVRGGPVVEGKPDQKPDEMLYVKLADRRGFEAKIYAADPRSDLAVLKIAATDLTPLKLGLSAPVRKGQLVIALGNPYAIARDGSASATWGIISNVGRQAMLEGDRNDSEYLRKQTVHHLGTLLQIDTRLELGTSGGALLNLKGELIGMTTSLAAIVGYEKSAGFAIPFDEPMKRVIKTLSEGKEVEYGFLGIHPSEIGPGQSEWAPLFERIKQQGAATIEFVVPNLPAHRGGLMEGDLVLRVGDKPIFNQNDLMREIGLTKPGTKVNIKIFRRIPSQDLGREIDVSVEVGKWPVTDEEGIIATNPLRSDWQGIVYDYATARKRFLSTIPQRQPAGVRVMEVRPATEAASRGVLAGDLITQVRGTAVRSPREFAEAVENGTGQVVLKVLTPSDRNAVERDVVIKPR
jgi:serine protease Do